MKRKWTETGKFGSLVSHDKEDNARYCIMSNANFTVLYIWDKSLNVIVDVAIVDSLVDVISYNDHHIIFQCNNLNMEDNLYLHEINTL